jgi:hypothetical protein
MADLVCEDEIDGKRTAVLESDGCVVLPASRRRYVYTSKDKAALEDAFRSAVAIEDCRS